MEGGTTKMTYVTKLRGADITPGEYRVLMTIWTYTNSDMANAWAGRDRLQADTGMSREGVRLALRSLQEKGYLILTEKGGYRDGRKMADVYALTLPTQLAEDANSVGRPLPTQWPPSDPYHQVLTSGPTPDADIVPMPVPDAPEPRPGGHRRNHAKPRTLLQLARAVAQAQTDDDHEHASEEFLDAFTDQYGDDTEARDLYWNKGFSERLEQLAHEGGIDYGTATWLGIFTNTYKDAS